MKSKVLNLNNRNKTETASFFGIDAYKPKSSMKKSLRFTNQIYEKDFQASLRTDMVENKLKLDFAHSLSIFLTSYYTISVVYLLSYILNFIYAEVSHKALMMQLILIAGQLLINSLVYFFGFYLRIKIKCRLILYEISYVVFGASLILCSNPITEMFFSYESKSYLTCLPGLLVLLSVSQFVLFTSFFKFLM